MGKVNIPVFLLAAGVLTVLIGILFWTIDGFRNVRFSWLLQVLAALSIAATFYYLGRLEDRSDVEDTAKAGAEGLNGATKAVHENVEDTAKAGAERLNGATKAVHESVDGATKAVHEPFQRSQSSLDACRAGLNGETKTVAETLQRSQSLLDAPKTDWHTTETTLRSILSFHDKHARYPKKEVDEAMAKHLGYMSKLEKALRAQSLCKRLEYTGSSYENLKIASAKLEFDVMFVRDGKGLKIDPIPSMSGYAFLQPSSADVEFAGLLDTQGRLCPSKVVSAFYGAVQKVVNAESLDNLLTLRMHGPAIQIDVLKKEEDLEPWFTVDLVPTYEIADEALQRSQSLLDAPKTVKLTKFVAKAAESSGSQDLISAWRRSFSEEEKDLLKNIDRENECRKKTLRILKAIFTREPTFRILRSYHLKTLLFHATENGDLQWREKNLADRLFGLLLDLQVALQRRELPNYFIPEINLFQTLEQVAATNVACRIGELLRSEKKFMNLLNKTAS